jgi:hypothetical protein
LWLVECLEDRIALAPITVTNLNDSGVGSLRAAIAQANVSSHPTSINFAPALTGTINLLSALPDLSANITLSGPGATTLTVARDTSSATPDFRIFAVDSGADVSISGLTLTGGTAVSGGGIANSGELTIDGVTIGANEALGASGSNGARRGPGVGGGLYNDGNGTLTILNSTIQANSAEGSIGGGYAYGGGIDNGGTLTIRNSAIQGNEARGGLGLGGGFGGGISNTGILSVAGCTVGGNAAGGSSGFALGDSGPGAGGGISNTGTATLADTLFSLNSAFDGYIGGSGGGISNAGTMTVMRCGIQDNGAVDGAGVANTGTLSLVGSSLNRNLALGRTIDSAFRVSGANGGGLSNSGTATVTNCTLRGNLASGGVASGGGIANYGTLAVLGSTLTGNSAAAGSSLSTNTGYGGGILNGGTATVTNSTLGANSASGKTGYGGAIFNEGGAVAINASTLVDNTAPHGGAVYAGAVSTAVGSTPQTAVVTTSDSLFATGVGGNIVLGPRLGQFTSFGHNLFNDMPSVALDRTDLTDEDPLVAPLADYGGPTLTYALLPGSPAIDAGAPIAGITTDQRGVPRPQGVAPDIGAFESRGFTLTSVGGSRQSAQVGASFAAPLALTVASPFGEPVIGGRVIFSAPTSGPAAVFTGNPAPIDANGRAAVTAAANNGIGTYDASARVGGPGGTLAFALTNVVVNPSLQVSPAPATNTVGQPETVTATVRSQNGTPVAGVSVIFQVTAGPNAGAMGVTNPANGQTSANGQAAFTYVGHGGDGIDSVFATADIPGLAAALASSVTVSWHSPPPVIISLQRFGFGPQRTTLVLTFNEPMNAARAEDLGNYTLVVLGHGRASRVPIKAAYYDNTAPAAITLVPTRSLSLVRKFRISANGTAPLGLSSAIGALLDGNRSGASGSDFVTTFGRYALAGSSNMAYNKVRYSWAGPGPFGGLQFPPPPTVATTASRGPITAAGAPANRVQRPV